MKFVAEKGAEEFLKEQGFKIIETFFCKNKKELLRASDKIKFPLVIKVSGKKIIHKNKIHGVKTNIISNLQLIKEFEKLKKINGVEGVLVQKQGVGEEFILGIKNTEEFGHAVAFGVGGINVEKLKKITFRIPPLNKTEIYDLIDEIASNLSRDKKRLIFQNIKKLCHLSLKFPKIKELDINPLLVDENSAFVVDARILF